MRIFAVLSVVILLSSCMMEEEHVAPSDISEWQEESARETGQKDSVQEIQDDIEAAMITESGSESVSAVTQEEQPLELRPIVPLPPILSLPAFASMRLAGTGLTLDALLDRTSTYDRHAISYWSNGLRITGILNIPHGEGPFPLVLLNHGYINPEVYTNGRGLKREQDHLARNGFAVLHSDYRGHAGSDKSPNPHLYDAGIEYAMDVVNAILAVQDSDLRRIDANRVGMLGHSLGGGVALNIAVAHPDIVDAIVLYAPVHSNAWENFTRWEKGRDEEDQTRKVFRSPEERPEIWEGLSSQTYLEKISAPVLLFHGTDDQDVPKEWSDDLEHRLQELGKEVTYVEYDGEKHEFISRFSDFMRVTSEFFDAEL